MKQSHRAIALLVGMAVLSPPVTTLDAQGNGRAYGRGGARLSGTYELVRNRGDDPRAVATRATQNLPAAQRDRAYNAVLNRLESPETLVLDVQGRSVAIMSSNAQRVAFNADGRDRTETGPNGRMVTTRADVRGGTLSVTMTGARGNDYTATFEPIPDGVRVTRRLETDFDRNQLVVRSEYRRVSDPRWNVVTTNNDPYRGGAGRQSLIPRNTRLVAHFDRSLNTDNLRNGESFSVTVVEPAQFNGAVITGTMGHPQTGDADNVAFDFDTVRLPDGRSADFAGVIEAVRMPNGKVLGVDQSGVVRGDDAGSNNALKNGAIGGAIGAILGAVVGGKKGAVIGGVAGAGGAIVLDRSVNNRTLPAGTQLTIREASAGYVVSRR